MIYLEYKLFSDGYVNRFLTAGTFSKNNPFHKIVLHGRVNDWLSKDSPIHDNPCRKEVATDRVGNIPPYMDMGGMLPGDEIEVFGQKKKLEVYFPFGSIGVDDSAFYTTPAYLRSYGITYLDVKEEENARFELSVCGALTVWLNDELIKDFVPFQRNRDSSAVIDFKLKKGLNKLVICIDDLAERDTGFIYKVRYRGSQDIIICIPVREDTDIETVERAEAALSQMYFEKDAYFSEQVVLNLESYTDRPVEMLLTPDRGFRQRNYIIQPNQKNMVLYHADDVPSNFYYFRLEVMVSGIKLKNVIGVYSLNTRHMGYHEDSYEERKERIRKIIREADSLDDYRAVIRLHDGETPDNLSEILLNHLSWVNEKRDCSDFRLIIMMYMYMRFSDRFPEKLRMDVEDAMVGYRYWIDEPGDDIMWFFSENHALMFHICQYFAGKAMPERIFTCSGLTGEEASKKAEGLLNAWFESFFTEFATEWNSSTYLPIDIMGLAYLYGLTEKGQELHEKAKRALDMLAFCLAVNEHSGTIMTSFGRTYERELKGSYSTGMTSLLYLFYNAGYMNEHFRALVPIVIGDYEPPKEYGQYTGLPGDNELIYQNTQGIYQCVNLYLYKNSKVLLSTAVGLRPYEPGYQENVVQAAIDGTAQVFVNQPGEVQIYGNGRPGFWAGNGSLPLAVQYKNISILKYRINPENQIDYTHAYVPLSEFDCYVKSELSVALEKNGGYIGVRTQNGLTLQEQGPCRNREFVSPGRDNIWILKVGRYGEYSSTDELLADMEKIKIEYGENNKVIITDGNRHYVIDDTQLYVDGKKVHNYPLDVAGVLEM